MNDLVSIIIPVYNVENYLLRCVESILKQTYENIEIILSDDGSKDKSGQLCDSLALKDKRIKVLHCENKGLSEARNRGLRIAGGKYVCFVDSDDWVDKDFVLKLLYTLKKTKSDISECKFKRTTDAEAKGNKNGSISSLDTKSALDLLCDDNYAKHIVVWNKMYKKSLFDKIEFPIGKLHEDEFTTHKLFSKATKVGFVDDELYFYFFNKNSITASKIIDKRLDSIEAYLERMTFFEANHYDDLKKKTSRLLFKNFCDYVSYKKSDFLDYKAFFHKLKRLYNMNKNKIYCDYLSKIEKFFYFLSRFSINWLKHVKLASYYCKRFKDKTRKLFKKNRLNKSPAFFKKAASLRKNDKKIAFILGCVEYLNYGDLAIGESVEQYVSKYYSTVEISQDETIKYIGKIKKIVRNNDLIVLPGGGNIGDVWKYDENIRRLVIKTFPNNKIIIFPQSINFLDTNSTYFKESVKLYSAHGKLTLFLRDFESLRKAEEYYKDLKTILIPDSVFLLRSNPNFVKHMTNKVGLCFRDDKEQSSDTIKQCLNIIDLLVDNDVEFDFITTVERGKTNLIERKDLVKEKLEEISSYKIIFTDRLHCIIFCSLTLTPCIALNNSNNKIKAFIEAWLSNVKTISLLNPNDILEVNIINQFTQISNNDNIDLSRSFYALEKIINE